MKHQVNALTSQNLNSFSSYISDPEFSKVFYSPCLAHIINLIFKKLNFKNNFFADYVKNLNKIAHLLRRPTYVKIIKSICPDTIETRWVYISRIVDWMIPKLELIRSALPESDFLCLSSLNYFSCIVEPLKGLINAFETDRSSICDAFPLIIDSINYYKNLKNIDETFIDTHWERIINDIIRLIEEHTLESKYGPLFALAYSFTPFGREAMQLKNLELESSTDIPFFNQRPNLSNYIRDPYSLLHISIPKIIDHNPLDQSYSDVEIFDELTETTSSDSDYFNFKQYISGSNSEDDNDECSDNSDLDINYCQESITKSKDWFRICYDCCVELNAFLFDEVESIKISKDAIYWWDGTLGIPFKGQLKNGGYPFWKAVQLSSNKGDSIAPFVLHLYSCLASEAPCERIFSKMKNIVSNKRFLLSHKTVFDLLVLGNDQEK